MTVVIIGDNTGDDYAGTEDAFIFGVSSYVNTNYGSNAQFRVTAWDVPNNDIRNGLLSFSGISNLPSSITVDSATIHLYLESENNSTSGGVTSNHIETRRLLRDWVESQATWNDYATGSAWSTAGGTSDGNDRVSSLSMHKLENDMPTSQYRVFGGARLAQDVEDFAAGTNSNYGWHFQNLNAYDSSINYFVEDNYTSSDGSDGQRPYLRVEYSSNDLQYVGVYEAVVSSDATSITITVDGAPKDGDLLLAIISKDDDDAITNPTGWTTVTDATVGITPDSNRLHVAYRIASSEGTDPSYTFTADSEQWCAAIYHYRNADTSSPVNVAGNSTGSSTSPTSPSITPTVDGCIILAGFACDEDNVPLTVDTGLHQHTSINSESNDAGACGLAIGYKSQTTAQSTGTFTHSQSTAVNWAAFTIAIAPSSGATESPAKGLIVFKGYAPQETTTKTKTPVSGRLFLKGYEPTESTFTVATKSPAKGLLLLKGLEPTEITKTVKQPVSGRLIFKGYTPIETTTGVVKSPEPGKLFLKGYTPKEITITVKTPVSGRLIFKGYEPLGVNARTVSPVTGKLIIKGYTPSETLIVTKIVQPEAGRLVFKGHTPRENIAKVIVYPVAGKLVIKGYTPVEYGHSWSAVASHTDSWSSIASASTTWSSLTTVSDTWTKLR